ncbi:ionotropic receptor 21a-like [Hyalella azteca]|uniref:Ionotropic receptor 21a-like n=1 Tax=Hyalella azteca TaxID=294128 RepID=A0A8B7P0E7_HYAAZ|nr:ionotropic receptor 21a-like [Hyalella azteca]
MDEFQGKTLHLATDVDDFPLVYELEDGTVTGLNIKIIAELALRFNFSFTTTKKSPDFLWGNCDNDSWSGLLGLVQSGQKELTINYFSMALDLKPHVHFDASIPYFWEGFGFALKMPPPQPPWKNLLSPFQIQVWMSVLLIVLVVPAFMCALYWLSFGDIMARRMRASDIYIQHLMGFLQQSVSVTPSSPGLRMANFTWWLFCLLVTLYYSSNLFAVLTVPVFPQRLSTVKDLEKSGLRLAMVYYGEFLSEALLTSGNADLEALGRRMDLIELPDADSARHYQQLLLYMKSGSHAITETFSFLQALLRRSNSSHYLLKEQIFSGPLVFFFRKGSRWRKKINSGIRRLTEAGVIQKWYKDLMENRKNEPDKTTHPSGLTLYHLQGPFLLFVLENAVAAATLVAEILSYKYSERFRQRNESNESAN